MRRGMTGCPPPLDDPVLIHERFALIGKDFRNKSVIAQTIIVGIRYCPNMKKYLALVLFTLFAASAFAQPYRHHRHHRHHHPHAVAVR